MIQISNIVKAKKSKYADRHIYGILVKLLLIIAGVLFPLCAFLDVMEINYNRFAVFAVIIVSAVVPKLLTAAKRGKIVCLCLMLVSMLIFFWFVWEKLLDGILIIANQYLEKYEVYFQSYIKAYAVKTDSPYSSVNLLVCVVACELTFLVYAFTWRRIYCRIYYLLAFVFMGPVLVVGYMPGMWYTVGMIACLTAATVGARTSKYRKKDLQVQTSYRVNDCINAKAYTLILCLLALVFGATVAIVNPKGYSRNASINDVKKYVINQLKRVQSMELFNGMFGWGKSIKASGGISGGKLGQSDELSFDNVSALHVTVPADSKGFYIRGFVGVNYENNSWKASSFSQKDLYDWYNLESRDWLSMTYDGLVQRIIEDENFARLYQDKMSDSITIEPTGADRSYFYAPYFSYLSQYRKQYDMTVDERMPDRLQLSIINFSIGDNYDDLVMLLDLLDDSDYESYVFESYVYDDVLSDQIEREFLEHSDFAYFNGYNYQECINAVKDYLRQNMTYSLTPGRLKEGEDFLEKFLLENKAGYCTHFATAATILLRQEGVPARYVEGYIVTEQDYKNNRISKKQNQKFIAPDGTMGNKEYLELDIKDTNAHAWTEVYIRGFGWVPVEVTPGYDNVIRGQVDNPPTETSSADTSATTTTASSTQNTTNKGSSRKPQEKNSQSSNFIYVWICLFFLMAAGSVIYAVIHHRQQKTYARLHSDDLRSSISYGAEYFQKVCRLTGFVIKNEELVAETAAKAAEKFGLDEQQFSEFFEIMEKFYYARQDVSFTEEERSLVIGVLYQCLEACEKISLRQKLLVRYVWCIKNQLKENSGC